MKSAPKGVMDASYAEERQRRPALRFRLESRAWAASQAYRRVTGVSRVDCILDMGAAEGETLVVLHRLLDAATCVGIEYSASLVAAAALPEGCRLLQGDVTEPHSEVAEGSFDLVTALAVLEHLAQPQKLLRQAHRALKPGGLFVATCPVPSWDRVSAKLGLHREEFHAGEVDGERFFALAREAELEPLRYERFMLAPVGFLPYLGWTPPIRGAHRMDRAVARLRLFDFLFVNQLFVARRP